MGGKIESNLVRIPESIDISNTPTTIITTSNNLSDSDYDGVDILLNPVPISKQQDILKKVKILNEMMIYGLGEWNDKYDRMQ